MRAIKLQEADRTRLVAERDEVLAEDAQAPRQLAQFAGEDDRLPEAPQIFPARLARPDPGQLMILGRPLAMVIGAVGGAQKRRSLSHALAPRSFIDHLSPRSPEIREKNRARRTNRPEPSLTIPCISKPYIAKSRAANR